jgi:predicted Fe-S protein YdhL (DUF1289 family)
MTPGGTVPSPCVSVCRMDDATGWCEGCMRTLDEIAAWSLFDDSEKRAVWAELDARRRQFERERNARPGRPGGA